MADGSGKDRESPALTREGHIARAMLMRARYIPHHGYYISWDNGAKDDMGFKQRYDALTLEPLKHEEVQRRQKEKYKAVWYD